MRAALLAAATWALAGAAHAENLTPSHVRITVSGTTARFVVGMRLRVDAPGPYGTTLDRPLHSVVTGGSISDRTGSHPMKLARAGDAQAAYDALADAPKQRVMGTLVQLAESSGSASMSVLVPRAGVMSIELHIEGAACFDGDARYVSVPTSWLPALAPEVRRRAVSGVRQQALSTRCTGDGELEGETWIGLPALELARRAAGEARIGVSAARFSDGAHQAARIELAIAKTLGAVPADLHTAFVIDTSRSLSSDESGAARGIVRSYLAHAPHSSVQVIGFARTATPLLASWSSAGATARAIDARLAKIDARNGSELQPALHEAGSWLARIEGTRRVVIITDERVADRVARLAATTLAKELPAGTLVHVVALGGRGVLSRDDAARWSGLAALTEGMATRCPVGDVASIDAVALVRPIALDHVRITAPSWTKLDGFQAECVDRDAEAPLSLDEGRSCTWWGQSTAGDTVDVEGLLWNHRWHQSVALGDRADVGLARQLGFVLDAAEPLAIAALDAAQAVSERWSLVARWGGAGGYADHLGGGTGFGAVCGCDAPGTIGHGSGTGGITRAIQPLRSQLAPVVEPCLRPDVSVALTVETTLDEIVDVHAKATARTGSAPYADAAAIEACVEEAVWNQDVHMQPHEHETTVLKF